MKIIKLTKRMLELVLNGPAQAFVYFYVID